MASTPMQTWYPCGVACASGELVELERTVDASGQPTGSWATAATYLRAGTGCKSVVLKKTDSSNVTRWSHYDVWLKPALETDASATIKTRLIYDRFDELRYYSETGIQPTQVKKPKQQDGIDFRIDCSPLLTGRGRVDASCKDRLDICRTRYDLCKDACDNAFNYAATTAGAVGSTLLTGGGFIVSSGAGATPVGATAAIVLGLIGLGLTVISGLAIAKKGTRCKNCCLDGMVRCFSPNPPSFDPRSCVAEVERSSAF